jgi:hypothetical protein
MTTQTFDIQDIPESIRVKYGITADGGELVIRTPFYAFIGINSIECIKHEIDCIIIRCTHVGFRFYYDDRIPSVIDY